MDRGWNDPPMLGLESSGPPKTKLQLNKRVAYPSMVAPNTDPTVPTAPPTTRNNELTEIASSPPRLHPFLNGGPPRAPFTVGDAPITCPIPTPSLSKVPASTDASSAPPPALNSHSSSSSSSSSSSWVPSKEKRERVITFFRCLCQDSQRKNWLSQKQVSDILKKIGSLEQQWAGQSVSLGDSDPPLNADVEEKLVKMVEAAEAGTWDQALHIQVALAVDHAGLVKKWAMAIKKLLLTAQSHSSKDAPANPNPSPTPPPYFQPSSANGS